jgi:hypothetical protein
MTEQDPDILEMKRANRKALLNKLSYVGIALLALAIFVLRGYGKVRTELEEGGMTDVTVEMHNPIEWGFQGKKNGMQCGGTITRLPFSMSKNESCFGTSGGQVGTTR